MAKKLKLIRTWWPGRSGDNESYDLYVDGEQWFFPSGATSGRTEGEILMAFLNDPAASGYTLEMESKKDVSS